jgi:hypothetical protein
VLITLAVCATFVRAEDKTITPDPCDPNAANRVDEKERIVDKIDYPFVDDPCVIGSWRAVDFVREIEAFNPQQKSWKGELWLNFLIFDVNGVMAGSGFLTWTRGMMINPNEQTASAYTIREMNGSNYMFLEWKSGDYTIRHQKPLYYVLKKVPIESIGQIEPMFGKPHEIPLTSTIDPNGRLVDKIDYPFESDPCVTGVWKTVDFVDELDKFQAGITRFKGDFIFKGMTIFPNGNTSWGYIWTKGLLIDEREKTASKYLIKEIEGSRYIFFEWKSGDYVFSYTKPMYYVMKYKGPVAPASTKQSIQQADLEFRTAFPEKIKLFDVNQASPEQAIQVFGEPLKYIYKNLEFTKDNLPNKYIMVYPDKFRVYVQDKSVRKLRYKHQGYAFYSAEVGSTLDQVIKAVPPTEIVAGEMIEDESGVLYKDIIEVPGYCYYRPAGSNIVFIFKNNVVREIYQACGR